MMGKPRIKALILALMFLSLVGAAQAAESPSLIERVCNVSEQGIIGGITVGGALERIGIDVDAALFFCSYSSLIQRAERLGNNFVGGLGSFAEGIGEDLLAGTLDLLGQQVGAQGWAEELNEQLGSAQAQLDEAIDGLEQGVDGSLAEYRSALRGAFSEARQAASEALLQDIADPERHPEGSKARHDAEQLALNPVLAAQVDELNQSLLTAGEQRAEANAALKASEVAASSFLDDTSFTDVVAGVVTPADPENPASTGGSADQLVRASGQATSTREAINELSRGFADYMRQDAVLSANVIEGLRANVQQQAITNWQLQQTAERELEKEYKRIEEQQALLEAQIATNKAEIEEAFGAISSSLLTIESIFDYEPSPEYCALVGGC